MRCLPVAASDTSGATRLYRNLDNRGGNRLYPNELAGASCEVETNTVDRDLDELAVRELNFIKMDVQGCEGKVPAGMQDTLRQSFALTVLTEFWPSGLRQAGTDPASVLALLAEAGFRLFLLKGSGRLQALGHTPGSSIHSRAADTRMWRRSRARTPRFRIKNMRPPVCSDSIFSTITGDSHHSFRWETADVIRT